MTTTLPSARSQELYAALKGRRTPVEVGLQTAEDAAYLASRAGRISHWVNQKRIDERVALPASVAGGISFLGFVVGMAELGTAAATAGEAIVAGVSGAGLCGLFGGVLGLHTLVEKAENALPQDVREALFDSLVDDLHAANHSVIESSWENLTFTTQCGLVVTGEDENGDLVLLLNGSPLSISYEGISAESRKFITSITGQRIPVLSGSTTA